MSKSNETTPNVPTLRFDKLRDFHRQKLGTLCTIVGGYAFDSKKMMTKGNYQIVKMGNFYAGNLDLSRTPTFLDEPTPSELSALLKKHDIVITLTGTVNKKDYGYTVQINNEKNLLLNQRCALIRAKDSIDNNYLLYLLKSNEFLSQFYASSVGGTGNQTNVSIKAIEQFIVSIPHIDEQKRIGKFLSDIDKRIEIQNKIISDLKVLKKELMDYILSTCDFMELSIKDLIDFGFARIIKASEMKKFDGTRQYLSTSSIGENGIEQVESIITYTDRPSRASMLPIKGSIWFAKMKNSIKVYQSTNDDENRYILSTGFYGLLCDETKVNSRWIIELFKSDYFNTQKDRFSEGSSMSGIKDSQLADITLKVFADKKQEKYHTNNIQNLSKKIQLEKNTLELLLKQKQFFLNAMFT